MTDPEADWYFSFGSEHRAHPYDYSMHYVKIRGNVWAARAAMHRRFGAGWSTIYDAVQIQRLIAEFGWTELPADAPGIVE